MVRGRDSEKPCWIPCPGARGEIRLRNNSLDLARTLRQFHRLLAALTEFLNSWPSFVQPSRLTSFFSDEVESSIAGKFETDRKTNWPKVFRSLPTTTEGRDSILR